MEAALIKSDLYDALKNPPNRRMQTHTVSMAWSGAGGLFRRFSRCPETAFALSR
jgi:hypothetical protein